LLVEQTIRPQVDGLLEGNQALAAAFDQILSFVDHTGVTSLGFVGLLTLLYAATRLLRNIESALNELWGVSGGRTAVEQLRDYVAIIVVTPLCLIGAAGLTTAGQALSLLRAAGETLGLGSALDTLIGLLGPLGVLFVGLLVLYKVMPYTKVSLGSAVLGALVGAVLWYLVLIAHVRFQVGVARFNALYSSFGAIPIFLAWLQLSWLVVLVGAQVSSSHQNTRVLARQRRRAEDDRAEEERSGLSATLIIAEAFLHAQEPPTCSALARELDRTEGFLRTQLERLFEARILARVEGRDDPVFVLARPAAQIRVKDALDALRELPAAAPDAPPGGSELQLHARELWQALDDAATQSSANRTLYDVLAARRASASEVR
jgi:membrane protein